MNAPTLTSSLIRQALKLASKTDPSHSGGKDPEREFPGISTDSRKIPGGCLFVALAGDQFDGHDFIGAALEKGAGGILCARDRVPAELKARFPDRDFFETESSLIGFRQLAAYWRAQFQIPVLVVAGSVGKTTTKEILAAILRGKWPETLKTEGSQNGFIGIPLTLLELRPRHGAAVIEVGIDEVGAMVEHLDLVRPTASLLTAIGPEHLENLHDMPTVAQEEGFALSRVYASGGSVVINLDDPWIMPHFETLEGGPGRKHAFTLGGTPPFPDIVRGETSGSELIVRGPGFPAAGGERFALPLPGGHNARNLLCALTAASVLGLTPGEMRQGLTTFKGAQGRSEMRALAGDTPVVCDYYNAQPASMEAGLQLLSEIARGRTKWACLGDMLEMGRNEEALHRQLSEKIAQLKVDHVLLYGPRMKWLENELKKSGFQGECAHFETHDALAAQLTRGLKKGDAILIKGSRGMKMEEIWKRLERFASENWV